MHRLSLTRRDLLKRGAAVAACSALGLRASALDEQPEFRLATFTAEVTVPLGHALMGGGIAPAKTIEDPLYANGFVLTGGDKPVVVVAVDWCEIRNDAYERWRTVLAEAAGTVPKLVLVTCIHQHDAPVADLEAERILRKHQAKGSVCDIDFHEKAVQRVARALGDSSKTATRITHVGTGQAKVDKVASNRRYLGPGDKPLFNRTSATRDPKVREHAEGTIDPWLKAVSFWNGDEPVAVLSCYATHPMSYYGKGGVTSDFIGLARKQRQADTPRVFQMYTSGCSGNVTAGKYNDGSPENRPVLAQRIHEAMKAAFEATKRTPLTRLAFRTTSIRLEPRGGPGFTEDDLTKKLDAEKPFQQCLAAMGLSWRKRVAAGRSIDVPVLDLGAALLLLLPGESYVEYQLAAQKMCPDSFVLTMGYGECATGYIPTQKAVDEGDTNLSDWCWVAPGAEKEMLEAMEEVLRARR